MSHFFPVTPPAPTELGAAGAPAVPLVTGSALCAGDADSTGGEVTATSPTPGAPPCWAGFLCEESQQIRATEKTKDKISDLMFMYLLNSSSLCFWNMRVIYG